MAQDSNIQELLALHGRLLASLTKGATLQQDQIMEKLSNSISEFCYDPTNSSSKQNNAKGNQIAQDTM